MGFYAYNHHAEPPSIRVKPGVNALVTTWFRKTKLGLEEQVAAWSRQGATIGIRDYLSYPAMDYDLPSRASGLRSIDKFAKNWKDYHSWGARYYSGEAQDNWGINGLLYYAGSRGLWDVDEKISQDAILEEFLEKSFGPVKEDIRPYYRELELRPVHDEDLVNRLYSAIKAARSKTDDPAIVARLNDLTLYVRYLELNNRFSLTKDGGAKRKAAEEMFTHLFRARSHSVNHARGIMRDMRKRASIPFDEAEGGSLRAGVPPWSPDAPSYTPEEIAAMVDEGIANNARLEFDVTSYSDDLVPAAKLFTDPGESAPLPAADRPALYYTWADTPGVTWKIQIANRREQAFVVKAELWAKEEAAEEPVAESEIEIAPGATREMALKSPHSGLHRLFLSGPKIGDDLVLDPLHPWTISVAREESIQTLGSMRMADLFFYVPKGTKIIAARVQHGRGLVVNPEGQIVARVDNEPMVRVDVPEGMDGRLWKIQQWRGNPFRLLTVPPYFAASPKDLLLPREVVEASVSPDKSPD